MNKLRTFWHSPYPQLYQRWKSVVIPAVIIFLILYLLQPFGISQMKSGKLVMTLGAACVSLTASCVVNYLLPALFPSYYKEQNWTLGKLVLNLMLLFLLVTVGIWLYLSWWSGMPLNGGMFVAVLFWVLLLSPFPTVFFLMWNQNLLLARNLKEATEMNRCLAERKTVAEVKAETDGTGQVLTFGGGTKDVLEVEADSFLYAEAEGNYINVVYRSEASGKVERKLLRTTMKQAEEAIADCTFIVRCHRAFLVNVKRVVKVDGNSQGYRLKLDGCEDEIPVSRAYAKEVKTLIES